MHGECQRQTRALWVLERRPCPSGQGEQGARAWTCRHGPAAPMQGRALRALHASARAVHRTKSMALAPRIIIDAGHGGSEPAGNSSAYGGRGQRGVVEKDVTLDIAKHVVARLGGAAALTRS